MINPIDVYRNLGESTVRNQLSILENVELFDIIKKYMPDFIRKIYKCKDKEKIVNYIVFRSEKIANKGSVFSN